MEYVDLGRTGVKVSPFCLGTMNFGSRTDEAESAKIIDRAVELGVNFIDTANMYGNAKGGAGPGSSEEMIGKALKKNGHRNRIVLATKAHAQMDENDPNSGGLSRRHIIAECENSLRRLQTDHIDLYQLHVPMPDLPIDETLQALDDLVRSGKVRYIGTSNFPSWLIMKGLWTSSEMKLNRFVTEQPPYSMMFRLAEREVLPMAERNDVAILPWSPLWGGFLAGKYTKGDDNLPSDSRAAMEDWGSIWQARVTDRAWELLDLLNEMAAEKSCTVSQLTLAWTQHQSAVTSTIIGPRTVEQLEDNLGAMDVEITDEDCKRIDEIARPRGHLLNI
jgi:aryl-alcohol dehydrogenase-like predicted oxidoreductase